jgi:hypothetical protein
LYCIDDDGQILWQVKSSSPKHERDPFVALSVVNGALSADRFFGGEYRIDPDTGVAEETGWHK